MRRIPHEIERLMWLVAEDGDPRAVADFEARFPDYRLELAKHIAMISELRGAKRQVRPPDHIPKFVPRHQVTRPVYGRATFAMAALVLAAVGLASYSVSVALLGRGGEPAPVRELPVVQTTTPKEPQVTRTDSLVPVPTPNDNQVPQSRPTPDPDPLDKPITVQVEQASLSDALQMIASSAGVRLEVAPGLEDELVALNYQGMSAASIFADLGRRYDFTAFPQERGVVLIVPARKHGPEDENSSPGDSDGSRRSNGTWQTP